MAIRARGSSFQVDFTLKGQRVRADFRDHSAAERWEAEARAALLAGRPLPPVAAAQHSGTTWTLKVAVQRTYDDEWAKRKSGEKLHMNALAAVEFFGAHTAVNEITRDRIREYKAVLIAKGNSGSTVNRKLASLSKVLSVCIEEGKLERKPRIEREEEGQHHIRWLRDDLREEQRMFDAFKLLEHHDHADFCTVLLDTGLRCGELFALGTKGVMYDKPTRRLVLWSSSVKNKLSRAVPLTTRCVAILERRLVSHGDRPFPYDYDWLHGGWQKMRLLMKMQDDEQFTPHMLRHTCATRLCRKGLPLNLVKEWLGHKSISTTLRYAQVVPAHLDEARNLLESYGQESVTEDVTEPAASAKM